MANFVRPDEKRTRPGLYLILGGETTVFDNLPNEPITSVNTLLTDVNGVFLKTADNYYLVAKN